MIGELITITDDAHEAIRRYTEAKCLAVEGDEMTPALREECRSYAVEALTEILYANPDTFDFVRRLAAIAERKAGR